MRGFFPFAASILTLAINSFGAPSLADIAILRANGMTVTGKFHSQIGGKLAGSVLEISEFTFDGQKGGGYDSKFDSKLIYVNGLQFQPQGESWKGGIFPTGRTITKGGATYRVFFLTPEGAAAAIAKPVAEVVKENPGHWLTPEALSDYNANLKRK